MKDTAFVKPGIYRFILWYGSLNSRTLICIENYIITVLMLMVRFAMQGLLPPLVAHILFCIFRLGS